MAQSQTLTTQAEVSPSSHSQLRQRLTRRLRRWKDRRCAAGPSSAMWQSPGRVVVAVAVVEVAVVVVDVEEPGEEEGVAGAACPYLRVVEAREPTKRCPLTDMFGHA